MKKLPHFVVVAGLVLSLSNSIRAEVREWTRASDGKKISAEFAGMKDETTVKVKLANGQIFELPLSGLSAEDNAFVKEQGSKGGAEKKSATAAAAGTPNPVVPEGPVTITLSKVHLCCKDCEQAVTNIPLNERTPIPAGVTITPDRKTESIIIAAPSGKDAKAALGAVLANGFYGVSDNEAVKIADLKPDEFVTDVMVVRDANLCCSACVKAFAKAVESVDGVKSQAAKAGAKSVKIEGKAFKPYDIMQALREAGIGGSFQ